MNVNDTLKERGSKYGNYLDQSNIVRKIFGVLMEARKGGYAMEADQYDALYMISVKLSRIVNGDPDYVDNWHDIAGYATLVADRLKASPQEKLRGAIGRPPEY